MLRRDRIVTSIICLIIFSLQTLYAQSAYIDSLKEILPSQSGESLAKSYADLCYEVRFTDAVEARKYCRKALAISQKEKIRWLEGVSYNYLGTTYQVQSGWDSSKYFQTLALDIFKDINDTIRIANALNSLGILEDERGNLQKATEYYLPAFSMYEAKNDQNGIARVSNNIGIIYRRLGGLDKSITFYKKALSIYRQLGIPFGVSVTEGNIAYVLLQKGELDSCIIYSEKAIQGYTALGYPQYIPYAQENMAQAYRQKDLPEKAFQLHTDALQGNLEYGNKKEAAYSLYQMASIQNNFRQYDDATKYANQSLEIAEEIQSKEELRNAFEILYKINESKGNTTQALFYYKEFVVMKDSIFESEKVNKIAELQTQFETELKETEIQKQKLVIEKVESKNKALTLWGIIGLLSILLGSAWFFYRNRIRVLQNVREKELEYQSSMTKAVINATENERKRIAEDLHDGIGQQLSGLKLNFERIKEESSDSLILRGFEKLLNETATEVRAISHQIMPKAIHTAGLKAALSELMDASFLHSKISHEFDVIGNFNNLNNESKIGVYRIVQELINNTIKHAGATEVDVQFVIQSNQMLMTYEDNGIGLGRSSRHSSGHGLLNMQSRAQAIQGNITFENGPKNGMVATLALTL